MNDVMNEVEKQYEAAKQQFAGADWNEYETPGGKVTVNPDGLEAIVMTDGRYPTVEDGYQINDYISETETVLWGAAVIEFPDSEELIITTIGQSCTFIPKKRFSIAGKCVCKVVMDQKWESSQKHYVK